MISDKPASSEITSIFCVWVSRYRALALTN